MHFYSQNSIKGGSRKVTEESGGGRRDGRRSAAVDSNKYRSSDIDLIGPNLSQKGKLKIGRGRHVTHGGHPFIDDGDWCRLPSGPGAS